MLPYSNTTHVGIVHCTLKQNSASLAIYIFLTRASINIRHRQTGERQVYICTCAAEISIFISYRHVPIEDQHTCT